MASNTWKQMVARIQAAEDVTKGYRDEMSGLVSFDVETNGDLRRGDFLIMCSGPHNSKDSVGHAFLKERQNLTEPNKQYFLKPGALKGADILTDDRPAPEVVDDTWMPAKYDQAKGRVLRARPVTKILINLIELGPKTSRNVREGHYNKKVKGRHTRKHKPHVIKHLALERHVWESLRKKQRELQEQGVFGIQKEDHEAQ